MKSNGKKKNQSVIPKVCVCVRYIKMYMIIDSILYKYGEYIYFFID